MEILLMNYLREPEKTLGGAAWATTTEQAGAEFEPTEKQVSEMINYTKSMKLSSVLDIPFFVFSMKDISRAFTHQWVRYRIAAHMQQSLRYTKVSTDSFDWFQMPPEISKKGSEAVIEYVKSQLRAAETYESLVKRGVPTEDARFALPIGVKTHITTGMNAEELLHVMAQRCCLDAQWEIRSVAYALYAMGMFVAPRIFRGAGAHCVSEGVCRGRGRDKCRPYAKGMIRKLDALVRKNSHRYERLRKGWFELDLTSVLGYRVPDDVKEDVHEAFDADVEIDMPVTLKIKKW
jgi:thymidylate synthase (FAD)